MAWRLDQIITAPQHAAFLRENTRLQQFQKEQERLQREVSFLQTTERAAQALINLSPPSCFVTLRGIDEQLAAFRGIDEQLAAFRGIDKQLAAFRGIDDPSLKTVPQVRQHNPIASERRMCAAALQDFTHNPEHVRWFITHALRLPFSSSCLGAVWQALHTGDWMHAAEPLKCIRDGVIRLSAQDAQQNLSLFTPDNSSSRQASSHDEEQDLSVGMASLERDGHGRPALSTAVYPQQKRGRPPGSGVYANAHDFLKAILPIIEHLKHDGVRPSQKRIVELLPFKTSVRQLQRWIEKHQLSWADILDST